MMQHTWVRAIYRHGTLQLQEPVDLPEETEVWVELQSVHQCGQETVSLQQPSQPGPAYPTRPQPPESLERLVGLIAVGGDALVDAEALYDADWH